jgi:hypothetical protein
MFQVRSKYKTPECNLVDSKETESSEIEISKIADDDKVYCIF